jgi:tetratricopeptide (TPR) repeat protein
MKMKLLVTLILSFAFLGCAGQPTQTQKGSSLTQAASTSPALPDAAYMSSRLTTAPRQDDCPQNDKSWKRESLKNLSFYANSCARLGKSERLDQIGTFIAQKEPLMPWGPYYMSVAAELQKEFARSLWMIDLAIKKSPTTALLHYQKGRIHWSLGEYAKAVESYNIAIQYYPRFADAHLFLAQLHLRDQDFKNAAKHFSVVAGIETDNAVAYAGWAEAKIAMGDSRGAIELYEKAVNASPRNVGYRTKLAGLYENTQKDLELALSTYKKLKSLVAETRAPAEEVGLNVNDKIQNLELALAKIAAESDAKMTQSKPSEKDKKKVKK